MSDTSTAFRTVIRGYEPSQVDSRVRELAEALEAARRQSVELAKRVEDLEKSQSSRPGSNEPNFADFGERVGKILTLAEEDAAELRTKANADIDALHKEAKEVAGRIRDEADRYGKEKRVTADLEAEQVIKDARDKALDIRAEADTDAAARRKEAEAIFEQQRSKAVQAATEFETQLAQRRERAELDLQERTGAAEQHLAAVQEHAEQVRSDAEQAHNEAKQKTERLVYESQRKSQQILSEATARADRIRTESERELAAIKHRRDSINGQLINVRQMLATLELEGDAPNQLVVGSTTDSTLALPMGSDSKK